MECGRIGFDRDSNRATKELMCSVWALTRISLKQMIMDGRRMELELMVLLTVGKLMTAMDDGFCL